MTTLAVIFFFFFFSLLSQFGSEFRLVLFQEDIVTLTGQVRVSDALDSSSRPNTNITRPDGTAAVQESTTSEVQHRPAESGTERDKGEKDKQAAQPSEASDALPCFVDSVSTTGITTEQEDDDKVVPNKETAPVPPAQPANETQNRGGEQDGQVQRQDGRKATSPPLASTPSEASGITWLRGTAPPEGAEGEAPESSQPSIPAADADPQDQSQDTSPSTRPKRMRREAAKKWNPRTKEAEQVEVQPSRFVFQLFVPVDWGKTLSWFTFCGSLYNKHFTVQVFS